MHDQMLGWNQSLQILITWIHAVHATVVLMLTQSTSCSKHTKATIN